MLKKHMTHSYCVALANICGGEAKIILYESNMMYWVDYEAWNGISNEIFVRTVLEYDKTADLQSVEKEFAEYMKVKK